MIVKNKPAAPKTYKSVTGTPSSFKRAKESDGHRKITPPLYSDTNISRSDKVGK